MTKIKKHENITCEDIFALMKTLCCPNTYVSLSIDIHDGEIKHVENRWKSRGKTEILDFMYRFGKENNNG